MMQLKMLVGKKGQWGPLGQWGQNLHCFAVPKMSPMSPLSPKSLFFSRNCYDFLQHKPSLWDLIIFDLQAYGFAPQSSMVLLFVYSFLLSLWLASEADLEACFTNFNLLTFPPVFRTCDEDFVTLL